MVADRLYAWDILSRNNQCRSLSLVTDRAPEFDNPITYDGIDVYESHMRPALPLEFGDAAAPPALPTLATGRPV